MARFKVHGTKELPYKAVNFLNINDLERGCRCKEDDVMHVFIDSQLVKIDTGEARIVIAGTSITVERGEILYISESTPWQIINLSNDCSGSVMTMNTENIKRKDDNTLITKKFQHLTNQKHKKSIARLTKVHDNFAKRKNKDNLATFDKYIELSIKELQQYVVSIGPEWESADCAKPVTDKSIFCDFVHGIACSDRFERSVDRHVERLNIVHSRLTRLCKNAVGLCPREIVNRMIVELALRKITRNSFSTTKLALYFGYNDSSNFITFFRERTGSTPTTYIPQTEDSSC